MTFDRVAILDWSAANGPKRGCDSIWLGFNDALPENLPTRAAALARLAALVESTLQDGQRLLIGADFAFGYPQGFPRALTGRDGALAVWQTLANRVWDDPRHRSNRIAVAAAINRALPGHGPFWFNPTRTDVPGLPHKGKKRHGHGFADLRICDRRAKGAQSVWKLGGPGAVGSQALTGLPVLWTLRAGFAGKVAVWPFEPIDAPVVLAEVFPTLIDPAVRQATGADAIRDAVQVTLLARALARLQDRNRLEPLFAQPNEASIADEGWILGLGHEAELLCAACESDDSA
jgi:hypothetical protein